MEIFLQSAKNETYENFVIFKNRIENATGQRVSVLHTDNGTEYINGDFKTLCNEAGIKHVTPPSHEKESNGIAEVMNRVIMDKVRCNLIYAGLSGGYWGEAALAAVYVLNRIPKSDMEKTPLELLFGKCPDLSRLRIFGCEAYIIPGDIKKRPKTARRSVKAKFMGYSEDGIGWKFALPTNKKERSTHAVFNENRFDWNTDPDLAIFNSSDGDDWYPNIVKDDAVPVDANTSSDSSDDEFITTAPRNSRTPSVPQSPVDSVPTPTDSTMSDYQPPHRCATPVLPSQPGPRRSTRTKRPVIERGYMLKDAEIDTPNSYKEAMQSADAAEWRKAMQVELAGLQEAGTWDEVDRPHHKNIMKGRWVYARKKDLAGKTIRFKARYVAKGFTQVEGLDYFDNDRYAPVARGETIRLMLALKVHLGLVTGQMDIVAAFLNGKLKDNEELYMELPPGYEIDGRCCKLKKTLYGLKQSAARWYESISEYLVSLGFKISKFDKCLFYRRNGDIFTAISLYVDDKLMFATLQVDIDDTKFKIADRYQAKDLGAAGQVLGMEVVEEGDAIWLLQRSYIRDVLIRYESQLVKPTPTPMEPNLHLLPNADPEKHDYPYQSVNGSVMYAMVNSRPDISFAVGQLARHASKSDKTHVFAMKHLLRYLKGTMNYGIRYKRQPGPLLQVFSDSDWAGDQGDRKSTSGYVVVVCGGAVAWTSKKQSVVALSSAEAEYYAFLEAVKATLYVHGILNELGVDTPFPIDINVDNQAAIAISRDEGNHAKVKHIDTRYHFIRDYVKGGCINPVWVPTDKNPADMFTKSLSRRKFEEFRQTIGVEEYVEKNEKRRSVDVSHSSNLIDGNVDKKSRSESICHADKSISNVEFCDWCD